jgi:protein disulfide-isomerase A1
MRFIRSLLVAAAAAAATTSVVSAGSDVVDLTSSNFQSEVMSENLALVEFFAPWVSGM